MKAKPPTLTLAGREHIASAADNVRLPTKRVATEPQQADHGPSEPRRIPREDQSKVRQSGEYRIGSGLEMVRIENHGTVQPHWGLMPTQQAALSCA